MYFIAYRSRVSAYLGRGPVRSLVEQCRASMGTAVQAAWRLMDGTNDENTSVCDRSVLGCSDTLRDETRAALSCGTDVVELSQFARDLQLWG